MADARTHPARSLTQWRLAALAAAVALLLAPVLAMRITGKLAWTPLDFAILALMLAAAWATGEILLGRGRSPTYRAASAITLLGLLLLAWIDGAVGIIGSEGNDANLLFAIVPAVGALGALLARLRPAGMARTLLAMAVAQVAIAAVALVGGLGTEGAAWPRDLIGATALFTALWLGAAVLFRQAARA